MGRSGRGPSDARESAIVGASSSACSATSSPCSSGRRGRPIERSERSHDSYSVGGSGSGPVSWSGSCSAPGAGAGGATALAGARSAESGTDGATSTATGPSASAALTAAAASARSGTSGVTSTTLGSSAARSSSGPAWVRDLGEHRAHRLRRRRLGDRLGRSAAAGSGHADAVLPRRGERLRAGRARWHRDCGVVGDDHGRPAGAAAAVPGGLDVPMVLVERLLGLGGTRRGLLDPGSTAFRPSGGSRGHHLGPGVLGLPRSGTALGAGRCRRAPGRGSGRGCGCVGRGAPRTSRRGHRWFGRDRRRNRRRGPGGRRRTERHRGGPQHRDSAGGRDPLQLGGEGGGELVVVDDPVARADCRMPAGSVVRHGEHRIDRPAPGGEARGVPRPTRPSPPATGAAARARRLRPPDGAARPRRRRPPARRGAPPWR